ncbi:Scube3 [Symbiodinium sp. KB8]|nr:Scube3 [Symbiodinium sp. KB8]
MFANGNGACNHQWAGYFYDGLWLVASILHAYLVNENRSISDLGTNYSREALYNLSLHQDFIGVTGRVRQFNGVEPTTDPASHGDREGIILLRQVTGPAEDAFTVLAHRSAAGFHFLKDVLWSKQDLSQSIPCAAGSCDLAAGWVPADQDSRCAGGKVWSNELGCVGCPAGSYSTASQASCFPCPRGSFSNSSGTASCEPCHPGSSGIIEGLVHCVDCPLGYFMNDSGAEECRKCPRDSYADSRGLSLCKPCPEGKSIEFEGATELSLCTCKGWLWLGQCVLCPYATRFEKGSCIQCAMDEICEDGRVVGHLPSKWEWAQSIEHAGHLPQLSQRLAKQLLLVVSGVRSEENQASLTRDMASFDWILQALISGNSTLGIVAAPNEEVADALSATAAMWASFSELLGRSPTDTVMHEVFDQNILLLDAVQNVLHSLLEAARAAGYSGSLVAEIAESQMMLVEKICKESLFVAAHFRVDRALQRLAEAKECYEAAHEALVLGVEAANIPKLTSLCTMHQMRDVTYYAKEVHRRVRGILNARTSEETLRLAQGFRNDMSVVVDPLSQAMSSAVHLFVQGDGTCDPLATTTQEQWMHLARGLAEQRMASQGVFRYFMQVVHGIDVASSKVDLAVQLAKNNNQLLGLVQGSREEDIPAPPTQELLSQLLKLHVAWQHMNKVLSDAVHQDEIAEVDITEVEVYNQEFLRDTDVVMELLAAVRHCPTLGILNITNRQATAFDMLFTQTALISYGHAGDNLDELNHTRAAFHVGCEVLLQGATAEEAGTDLRPVEDVCIVRAMASVARSFHLLEQESLAVVGGAGSEGLRRMMALSTEGISHMALASDFLLKYYANQSSVTCQDPLLSTTEWLQLIEHISLLAGLGEDASSAYMLTDGSKSNNQEAVASKIQEMASALRDMKFGAADAPLPPPPTQELFDKSTNGLHNALESFRMALLGVDRSAVLASCDDFLSQVHRMEADYVQAARATHPRWPGSRVRVASWQTVLAKKIFKESWLPTNLKRPGVLAATVTEFDTAHQRLRHGGGGLSGISNERQDLYQQWQKVDDLWSDLKQHVTGQTSSAEIMRATLQQLEQELHILVSLCGVVDPPATEKGTGLVVAIFAVVSSILAFCACCGPLLEYSRQRRARRKQQEHTHAKVGIQSGFPDSQDKPRNDITGIV